jgi:hypothetical protein
MVYNAVASIFLDTYHQFLPPMSTHEKKIHLVDMSSLSIPFQAKSGVSHSLPHRNTTSSLDRHFRIFSPTRCTEHTISHGYRVALIPSVIPRPNGPLVTTHRDCRLAPQANTSLCSALWPHSCAPKKTS